MLTTFQDRMELMDTQTMRKRKNRLLLYDDSMRDAMLASKAMKIKAMQDLKPIYPWNDRFQRGSFHMVSFRKGKKNQRSDTADQIMELNDLLDEMFDQKDAQGGVSYAGSGNERADIDQAIEKAESLLHFRVLEDALVEESTNAQLGNAIKNLRPDPNSPDNNTILNMSMMKKAEYLVETLGLGDDVARIKAAF